jgi:hypothetical protein
VIARHHRTVVQTVLAHPSAVLLAVQLVGVLIYPFMEDTPIGRGAFEVFGALVLALAVLSIRNSFGPVWVALTLGIVASGLAVADAVDHSHILLTLSALFHVLFYFWAATSLMIYMMADRTVTKDELYAIGATFTLVAWAFAYLFVLVQQLQPGSFTAAVNPEAARTWTELLFLSFTNLSSTGLSDIVPVTPHARSVVMIEQLAGLGYVALFVSRLVGLTLARHMAPSPREGSSPRGRDAAGS